MLQNPSHLLNPIPGDYDVLFTRGGTFDTRLGNQYYRSLICQNYEEYKNGSRDDKTRIVQDIVDYIAVTKEGSFYHFPSNGKEWQRLTDQELTTKLRQGLRDMAKRNLN